MVDQRYEPTMMLVAAADEPGTWLWWVVAGVVPLIVAAGAVLLAVWLAHRYELLGGARGARRKRRMDRAAKAYALKWRSEHKVPYIEPEPEREREPVRGRWWRRLWLWWLRRREQRIFDLIDEEFRQARFHKKVGEKLDEHFKDNLVSQRAAEAALGGIVAEELLRRSGELIAKWERRWWRRLWRRCRRREC